MRRLRPFVLVSMLAACGLLAGSAAAGSSWWWPSRGGGSPHGGGPPQARILSALEGIEERLAGMDARLAALEEETAAVQKQVTPCTPAAVRSGACAPEELADLTAQVCVTLGAQGALEAKYGVTSKTAVELGVGWDSVVDANLKAGLEGPLVLQPVPLVPVYVPVPDLELKGGATGGLGVNVCFREIELPAGADPDGFGTRLAEELEASAPRIRRAVRNAVASRELLQGRGFGQRVAGVLEGLDRVGSGEIRTEDPLAFFRPGSEFRALVDDLPVGEGVRNVLDDPESVYPLDAAQLAPDCERFDGSPVLDPLSQEVCDVLAELPDIDQVRQVPERAEELAERVRKIEQNVSDIQESLGTLTSVSPPLTPAPPPPPPTTCPGKLDRFCNLF